MIARKNTICRLFCCKVTRQGAMERRLLNDLFTDRDYNKLERPVLNETDALTVKFGLTIQQIIDVVSTELTILGRIMHQTKRLCYYYLRRSALCHAVRSVSLSFILSFCLCAALGGLSQKESADFTET